MVYTEVVWSYNGYHYVGIFFGITHIYTKVYFIFHYMIWPKILLVVYYTFYTWISQQVLKQRAIHFKILILNDAILDLYYHTSGFNTFYPLLKVSKPDLWYSHLNKKFHYFEFIHGSERDGVYLGILEKGISTVLDVYLA